MSITSKLSKTVVGANARFVKNRFNHVINDVEVAMIKGKLSPSLVTTRINFENRICRLDSNLNMSNVQDSVYGAVKGLLDRAGFNSWEIRTPHGKPRLLNLTESEFNSLIETISQGGLLPDHYYFQTLAPNHKTKGRTRLVRNIKSDLQADGLRIFEYAVNDQGSVFHSDEHQGVEIVKWVIPESGDHYESAVWNERIVDLPIEGPLDPQFQKDLESANRVFNTEVDFPIDVVFTWVDDTDPKWKLKRSKFDSNPELLLDQGDSDARFASHDELKYAIRSIRQNAPWVRKIWVVTDDQTPKWLDTSKTDLVQVVSHSEIWKDKSDLPVFNSHAIEANLHRIEGLADHYLYMNDDMMITRPVAPEKFFHGSGLGKVFLSRALVDHMENPYELNAPAIAAKNARNLFKDGFSRKFFHTPYPISKKVMEKMEEQYKDAFERTSKSKFRGIGDIAASGSMYFNYALENGYSTVGSIRYAYIDPAIPESLNRLKTIAIRKNFDCAVVNDGASEITEEQRAQMKRDLPIMLETIFPVPSDLEITSSESFASALLEAPEKSLNAQR